MWNFFRFLLMGIVASLAGTSVAHAAEIKVLSARPVQYAMPGLANEFHRDTGHRVEFVYETSPAIVKRLSSGEAADVILTTNNFFDRAVKSGNVIDGSRTVFGRIGVGVAVREGVAAPDVSTADALKRAVLQADSLSYTQLASGAHFAKVLERLGVAGDVKAKSRRFPATDEVFAHVLKGKGKDLGAGPVTQIIARKEKGLILVGPLPAELQNYEPYVAGLTKSASSPDVGRAFIKFLTSPPAQAAMAKTGIDRPN